MPSEKPSLYKQILYTEDTVQRQINELARRIIDLYKNKNPLFICMLRGGAPFSAQLMIAITKQDPTFYPELDYMTVRTYGDKRIPKAPEIIMELSPHTQPKNRPAIILDDVLDTGETAMFTREYLLNSGSSSVDLCVLVNKDVRRSIYRGKVLYGFDAPSNWLTGMGLDDTRIAPEANRWATYIAIANEL